MKKISTVVMAVLLVLTGCSSNTLLVAESFKKTMDLSSYESKTSISLSGHLPAAVPMDDKSKPFMDMLKNGIVIDTIQKNDRELHATISANNPAPILGSELWPYQKAPSFDLYMNGNNLSVKSSVDKKFLALTSEADHAQDSVMSEKMKQLMKAFVNQYEYNPQHLEKIGQEKVTLPDASVADTTHIRISLDMQEAKDMAAYTIDNLSRFEGLKDFPSLLPTTETQKEFDLTEIRKNLSDLAQQIKSKKVDDLKAEFDGKLLLNLWIDKDYQIVQNETNIYFRLPNDADHQSGSSDQADVNLTIWNQSWNHNKNIDIQYPSQENIVNVEKINKDIKLLKSFDKSSPTRFLAKSELLLQAKPFDDVPAPGYEWAYEPVTMLYQADIINGYENNEFKPERKITRAEFITMATKALGLKSVSTDLSFNDEDQIPDWANPSMQAAVKVGLIDGYEDGSIRPNQPISRAEIVTILVKGFHHPIAANYVLKYTDRNDIPNWALNYVRSATSEGLVDGYDDGSFAPNNQAKRSEVASILYKAIMMD